jgi:hypothetical protein
MHVLNGMLVELKPTGVTFERHEILDKVPQLVRHVLGPKHWSLSNLSNQSGRSVDVLVSICHIIVTLSSPGANQRSGFTWPVPSDRKLKANQKSSLTCWNLRRGHGI